MGTVHSKCSSSYCEPAILNIPKDLPKITPRSFDEILRAQDDLLELCPRAVFRRCCAQDHCGFVRNWAITNQRKIILPQRFLQPQYPFLYLISVGVKLIFL